MQDKISNKYAAIDPMSLILSEEAYLIWLEIHYPHNPNIAKIEQVIKGLSPAERNKAVANAQKVSEYCKAFIETASRIK
jgi:hypothetical protein